MSALDSCHFQVLHALQNDGWRVSDKPLYIDAETSIYIDIPASKDNPNGYQDIYRS